MNLHSPTHPETKEISMHWLVRMPGRGVAAMAAAGLLAAVTMAATPAAASVNTTLKVRYPVNGSTFLKAANATVTLGPGTLRSKVNLTTGAVTASLNLPPATGSFKEFGLIPVNATVAFLQNGPTTGTVDLSTGEVATTSSITLQITSLSVAGLPVPVGPSCESATPASISLASQPGFSIVKGGTVSGTYTVPPFAHCGLVTPVLNLTITGPGNTITLTLGKAHVIP
jgi:hypothetical protein